MKRQIFLLITLSVLSVAALGQMLQDTVVDIDGNVYHTVKIGTQIWMVENLKVTRFQNGDPIPIVKKDSLWRSQTKGAYCNYNNLATNSKTYGRLYNFYAIDDKRKIAPVGWHVPSDNEWQTLEQTLGMQKNITDSCGLRGTSEGGQLKETDTLHWKGLNIGATNSVGFTALPSGYRDINGKFIGLGSVASWWTSTEAIPKEYIKDLDKNLQQDAAYRSIINTKSVIIKYFGTRTQGFSVRCIKDE